MSVEQGIKDVIIGLSQSIDKDNMDSFKMISDNELVKSALESAKNGDHETFYLRLIYPFEGAISGMLSSINLNDDAKFLLTHGEFVERHFNKLINKYEGMACCSDKSRTIMRALLKFYMHDEKIVFNYKGEYTYHLPKSLFTIQEEITRFYRSIRELFYGNPTDYLKELSFIIKDNE